jgi:hypothetical protein
MANNLGSNITRQLARVFLEKFEASRVLTKAVNSQLLTGRFSPRSGSTVDFKRPHDYTSKRSSDGDISSSGKSNIISGKATGTVQNYITVAADYENLEEALNLDQLDEIIAPMATRMVTDLELDFASYMAKNCGLSYGVPGTIVDTWADIAGAGSLLDSVGVPKDQQWCYAVNPFVQQTLAGLQAGLNSGSNKLVDTAWERSIISDNFAGMRVMASNALPSRTITTAADLVGALDATPDLTYVTAKDSMTQAWVVTGFTASATVKAGDIIQVTGKYRVSNSTRLPMFDAAGAQILFQGIVTADVELDSSGEGTLVITGPGIYEATGAYNTTSAALASSDVITILGTSAAVVQPNLFFHPQAFGIGTVKIPKLSATDTTATTEDGMSIRVTRYSDGDKNEQTVRFDLLPAFATFNPFFAGQGFGLA